MTPSAHAGSLIGSIRRCAESADLEVVAVPDNTLRMAMTTGVSEGLDIAPLPGGKARVAIGVVLIVDHDAVRTASRSADEAVAKLAEKIDAAGAATLDQPVGVVARKLAEGLDATTAELAKLEQDESTLTTRWRDTVGTGDMAKAAKLEGELVALRAKRSAVADRANLLRENVTTTADQLREAERSARQSARDEADVVVAKELVDAEAVLAKAAAKMLTPLAISLAKRSFLDGLRG